MSSAAGTPYIINLPDGAELHLFRVTPLDRLKFRDRFRTVRKARYLQSLALTGMEGDELRAKLTEFDARKMRENDVIQWVTEEDGAAEMLALSIAHGWEIRRDGEIVTRVEPAEGRKAKDIPPEIEYVDYVAAAAAVANLVLTYKPEEPASGPPKNGESRQATGTGGERQTESDVGSPSTTIH